MARAKYLLILSGTCVARKKQITPVLSVKSIWWATENTLKTKKYIRPLKKVKIRVCEKTAKSVINNVSAYSTDSIVIARFFKDGNILLGYLKDSNAAAHSVDTGIS